MTPFKLDQTMEEALGVTTEDIVARGQRTLRAMLETHLTHIEEMAAAYLTRTNIPPEQVVLIEERDGLTTRYHYEQRQSPQDIQDRIAEITAVPTGWSKCIREMAEAIGSDVFGLTVAQTEKLWAIFVKAQAYDNRKGLYSETLLENAKLTAQRDYAQQMAAWIAGGYGEYERPTALAPEHDDGWRL